MTRDFGNEQDMPVAAKEHPSLGPTQEAQDVAGLNQIVVGMPAYTDPHNPMTLSGSVNLPLDRHPVTHSEDYGRDVGAHVAQSEDGNVSPMAAGAATLRDEDAKFNPPEDREEWTKAQWQMLARRHGLPTSGNLDTIKTRVEDHEATQEAVDARGRELHAMSRVDLDKLAGEYGIDPADHSRKEDLADAILDSEREQD